MEGKTLSTKFREFAGALCETNDVDQAFNLLDTYIQRMGFDAVLYTYIPSSVVQSGFASTPVYQASSSYTPKFVSHYLNAGFYNDDPLIKAVRDDVKQPIVWGGDICKSYTEIDKRSREVMDVAADYGIKKAVSIPLLTGNQSLAGINLLNFDSQNFDKLLNDTLPEMRVVANMYHNHMVANSGNLAHFIKPVFSALSVLELQFVAGLAEGISQRELAAKLGRSEKYLEQVFLRIRRKVSGVGALDKPTVNRNQLLYYAGLYNIVNFAVL